MRYPARFGLVLSGFALPAALAPGLSIAATVSGPLRLWHRVELSFVGPLHAENDGDPNPFLDYRLQCRLTGPSGQEYAVAGFFDTDGAGEHVGDLWKCRFSPDQAGTWRYVASLRRGSRLAVSLDPADGTPMLFDGEAGGFEVGPSDRLPPDFRARAHGMLTNPGGHYLVFRGSGRAWVKGGLNVPENFLGYAGFDNTPNAGHSYAAQVDEWNGGDPDWNGGAGRAIIGALNYLAATGGNGVYFLPMNIGGDGDDTFPTISRDDKTHYDTSKLAQWESVFTHADSLGVFLHFVLSEAESENASYHDGRELGPERKLFYRELIARFGHHLGIEWDLGEENSYGERRHREFAAYLRALDPYDHPVTTHTKFGRLEEFYAPLLGNPDFAMTAIQDGLTRIEDNVVEWRQRSAAAGVPWVISFDEPHPIENDPHDEERGYPSGRRNFMWPTYLSGGGGFEWYVKNDGGGDSFDQRVDDLHELAPALAWTGHATAFLRSLPLSRMAPAPAMSTADHTLAAPGAAYAMYVREQRSIAVELT